MISKSPMFRVLARFLARFVPVLLLLAGFSSCRDLKIPDGKLKCSAQKSCPSPYSCVDGFCYSPGHLRGDASVLSDAGDAPVDRQDGATSLDGPFPDRGPDATGPDATGPDVGTAGDARGDALASIPQAGACTADGECTTGHCVDGVCCDKACNGTCQACSGLFTGDVDGVCKPTKSGMNPHASVDCKAGKPEQCGNDGTCDGAGACKLYGSTQVCAAAACNGTVGAQSFQPSSTCDGKGACSAPVQQSCAQYNCSPTNGCAKPCATDMTCGDGNFCGSDGICRTKKIDGGSCTAANECAHAACVDGYCCDSDCTKKGCFSCSHDYTGQPNGQCQPVSRGKVSPRATDCKAGDAKSCGLDGTCDGAGACKSFDSSTLCADPVCTGTTFTATATCDGAGKCGAGAKTDCGQFQCTLSGCRKNCQQDTDCSEGSYCASDGTCAVKKTAGLTCTAGRECQAGFCTDGVCCGSACNQTCYGCSLSKTGKADGTCAPLKAGTSRSATECPASSMSSCGSDGTCDGAGKCHNWAQGSACLAGVCNASGYTGAKTCDGAGNCSGPAAVSCGSYPCNASTGCSVTCSASQPCMGDTYCDATSHCATKRTNGQGCSAGTECINGQCVEGVCCDSPCSGSCSSCTKAKNGLADGTCSPIAAGGPPKTPGSCAPDSSNACFQDGLCSGNGVCRKTPKGTSCGASSCSVGPTGATYTGPRSCDGSGSCGSGTSSGCGGYGCTADQLMCRGSCTADTDCVTGNHCESGICKLDCDPSVPGVCGSTATCVNKRCTPCANTVCGNMCINTKGTDKNNCGGCGTVCAGATSQCMAGVCKCTQNGDCPANNTCSNGSCITCGNGQTFCGTCVDVSTDQNNCGGCGKVCNGSCSSGLCYCLLNTSTYDTCVFK